MIRYGYIYHCLDIVTNKIYIGQKVGSKVVKNYFGSGKEWKKILSNRNSDQIIRTILEWCSSAEELNIREKFWIAFYNSTNPDIGYNISLGGNACSELSRLNMSNIIKKIMQNTEVRYRISNSLTNYRKVNKFTDEHRKNISNALLGNHNLSNYDTRSVPIECIINNSTIYFKNKRTAAIWWFNNYPFSTKFSEATYIRKINDCLENKVPTYNNKEINLLMRWKLSEIKS